MKRERTDPRASTTGSKSPSPGAAMRTDFVNSAAHELSTPLTPIRLQLRMLQDGLRGPLTPQQAWSVDIIQRNVERLTHLVKDLLDVARLEAERFPIDMRPTDLDAVVQDAIDSFRDPAEHAGLTMHVKLTPRLLVMADARRLIQVLFNLLANAIKFTPPGGRIVVSSRSQDRQAVVTIEDTGQGFRPGEVRKLFQPFTQLPQGDSSITHGAGLGLFISRNIVELHGGRITGGSRGPGKGSSFAFTLPLAATGETAQPIVTGVTGGAPAPTDFSTRIRQLV